MISELLTVTDAAYGGSLPVTTRHLFAQIVNGVPAVHNGGGQFTPVANDLNGSWSYQRFRGPIEATPSQLVGDPCTGVRVSVPLRIVALLPRDLCMEAAQAAVASLRGAQRAAKIAIGASSVGINRVTWSIAETASGEFNPAPQIPTSKALLIIDLTVTVEASQACVSGCEATDVTCALIEAASLDKIRECLGDRLAELCEFEPGDLCTEIAKPGSTAQAIVDCIAEADKTEAVQAILCDPCPPTTVNGTESDTPVITVTQGDVPVGTFNPETGNVDVPPCPAPETLCGLITEATSPEVVVCVKSSGKADAVRCELLADVEPGNAQTQILDCVTEPTFTAIREAQVCDLDAAAYLARVEAADAAFLEQGVRDAICDFVIGLKADGLWNSIGAAAILAGARTVAGAMVPLKGPSPTNVGFVIGDYNRETGLKGDGATKYINTNRNNNADPQDNNHNAVCISVQDDTGTSTAYMGAGVADNGSNLLGKSGTPPFNAVVRSRTSTAFTAATSGTGCLGISRSESANYTLRIAGSNQTVTQVSQTPHDANVFVFARNAAGSPTIPSNGRLAFYSMGTALNLAQLDTRVTALMTAINAAL